MTQERESRQYQLMKERLDEFKAGVIELGRLINDLDALLNNLEITDSQWIEDFKSEWWTLEEIYAVAIDRGIDYQMLDTEGSIEDSLNNMYVFLDQANTRLNLSSINKNT